MPDEKEKALSDEEFCHVAYAFHHDKLQPLEPLVEKYGWFELMDRIANCGDENLND